MAYLHRARKKSAAIASAVLMAFMLVFPFNVVNAYEPRNLEVSDTADNSVSFIDEQTSNDLDAQSSTLQAIDISIFQKGVSSYQWALLKKQGYDVAIVGSWHGVAWGANPYAEANLQSARSEDHKIATYLVLDSVMSGKEAVTKAKQACGSMWQHLSFVAIDLELEGITHQQIQDAIDAIRVEGKRPIIYTSKYWWDTFMTGDRFSDIPLWQARYDNNPRLSAVYRFGGWQNSIGKQYKADTVLTGRQNKALQDLILDFNPFDSVFVNGVG